MIRKKVEIMEFIVLASWVTFALGFIGMVKSFSENDPSIRFAYLITAFVFSLGGMWFGMNGVEAHAYIPIIGNFVLAYYVFTKMVQNKEASLY